VRIVAGRFLDLLGIQNIDAPAVSADDQFIFSRMDNQVMHGRCGQPVAERNPTLASVERGIHSKIRAHV